MNLKPNPEDNGQITPAFLKKLLKTDFKTYYTTQSLNDILYLHYKGFQVISGLQGFTGLKVLYFEGNAFKKIQGLDQLVNLRSLYLQQNLIREICGLENLTLLSNLNLSDNLIEKIQGLQTLTRLSNLQLKRNQIGVDGLSDLVGLLQCPSISALDLSDNRIQTTDIIPEILVKMPNIAVVYLQNNTFCKNVSHYRKTLISKIATLTYIDDKPIFEDQRRCAMAWARGGIQEERKQRALYKQEQEEAQIRQHRQFRAMIERHRQEAAASRFASTDSQSDTDTRSRNDSRDDSLETYNTPKDSSCSNLTDSQKGINSQSEKGLLSDSQKHSESDKLSNCQKQDANDLEIKSEDNKSTKSQSQKVELIPVKIQNYYKCEIPDLETPAANLDELD